ncbi:MAG: preprotein translocase subunit SecG [Patescibacteria group bacterium]
MFEILKWILVGDSVLLCLLVVIQSKGTGLSLAPGSGDFGKFEKRGPEKTLHVITIVLAVAFIVLATGLFFLGA